MPKNHKISFKIEFEEEFEEIYTYIFENSEQNARKFAGEIKLKIEWIIQNPSAGTIETKIYSKQNWYRFKILMKSWKIVYKVTENTLVFLSIIHVKRHSDEFEKLRKR
jgi:plasmid stabilization system protein ParE